MRRFAMNKFSKFIRSTPQTCPRLIEPLEARRLLAVAGTLDTSFSGDGKVTVDFPNGNVLFANDVAVQRDGKTVVAGGLFFGGNSLHFAIARLNLDGTPDLTFGQSGS